MPIVDNKEVAERFAQVYRWIGGGIRCFLVKKELSKKKHDENNYYQVFVHNEKEFVDFCLKSDVRRRFWVSFNPLKSDKRKIENVKSVMNIVIDVDTAGGATQETQEIVTKVINYLNYKTGVNGYQIPTFFSGNKGYHIWLQLKTIDLIDESHARKINKQMQKFIDELDRKFSTKATTIDSNAKGIE